MKEFDDLFLSGVLVAVVRHTSFYYHQLHNTNLLVSKRWSLSVRFQDKAFAL